MRTRECGREGGRIEQVCLDDLDAARRERSRTIACGIASGHPHLEPPLCE